MASRTEGMFVDCKFIGTVTHQFGDNGRPVVIEPPDPNREQPLLQYLAQLGDA